MIQESVSITTPDHVTLEFEIAGLGSRFVALLIDMTLIGMLVIVIAFGAAVSGFVGSSAVRELAGEEHAASWGVALLIVVLFTVVWGYGFFFEARMRGMTPGKRWVGIRVIREDGLPIGAREAALRNLARAADMLPPPLYLLGGVFVQFDRHGRRLGDMLAGTLVVRERFEADLNSVAGAAWAARVEQGFSRHAVTLPRGAISATQIALVEQFVARRHTLPGEKRAELAWSVVKPLLPLLGEATEGLERLPDRTERCEQLLLAILDAARTSSSARLNRAASSLRRPGLF